MSLRYLKAPSLQLEMVIKYKADVINRIWWRIKPMALNAGRDDQTLEEIIIMKAEEYREVAKMVVVLPVFCLIFAAIIL